MRRGLSGCSSRVAYFQQLEDESFLAGKPNAIAVILPQSENLV